MAYMWRISENNMWKSVLSFSVGQCIQLRFAAWQQAPHQLSHLVRSPFFLDSVLCILNWPQIPYCSYTDLEFLITLLHLLLSIKITGMFTIPHCMLWCRWNLGPEHADQVYYPLSCSLSMAAFTAQIKIPNEGSECHRETS